MALQVIRQGKGVQLVWKCSVLDPKGLPQIVFTPFDPPSLPLITIYDPTGAVVVNAQAMTKLPPPYGQTVSGMYSYIYLTPTNGPLNQPYTAKVDAVDALGNPAGSAQQSPPSETIPVFQVV